MTGQNFGAGSSREAAVWGMLANNIRVIVAKSFADIYRENCLQNGLLPVVLGPDEADAFIARVVAVERRGAVHGRSAKPEDQRAGRARHRVRIPAADRMRLLEGLDDIGLTLKHTDEIVAGRSEWRRPAVAADRRETAGAELHVMPGLAPGIHALAEGRRDAGKPGHDEAEWRN